MARKRAEKEVEEKKEEVTFQVEEDQVIPLSRNALITRVEFINEFLRHFGTFLSNDSLIAINAYKKALEDLLKAFEER